MGHAKHKSRWNAANGFVNLKRKTPEQGEYKSEWNPPAQEQAWLCYPKGRGRYQLRGRPCKTL